jgi:CHASE2 domain-containing sensor protein
MVALEPWPVDAGEPPEPLARSALRVPAAALVSADPPDDPGPAVVGAPDLAADRDGAPRRLEMTSAVMATAATATSVIAAARR